MPEPRTPSARREIADAALAMIGDADTGDLLRSITPERLAEASGRSASTVRYHFGGEAREGGGSYAFQRRDLVLAVLELALGDRVATSASSRDRYEAAAVELLETGETGAVFGAMAENLSSFIPGPAGEEAAARERVHHLGLAICDTDAAAARLLRDARSEQMDVFVPVFSAAIAAMGREPAPGRTVEQIADAVLVLLDGHLQRLRFDPGAPSDGIHAAALSVFVTFTRPRGGAAFDPVAEILGR
jgi:hypothetical protein